jgi:uncharacterized protein (DUF4415 family)
MATTRFTIPAGQRPSKEEWARIKAELAEARKHPIVYDEDCPELTPEQLAEFRPANGMTMEERAQMMRERRVKRKRRNVSIRLAPDCIETYKQLGKGYTGVMAEVLQYAAAHPDILKQAAL